MLLLLVLEPGLFVLHSEYSLGEGTHFILLIGEKQQPSAEVLGSSAPAEYPVPHSGRRRSLGVDHLAAAAGQLHKQGSLARMPNKPSRCLSCLSSSSKLDLRTVSHKLLRSSLDAGARFEFSSCSCRQQ